MTQQIPRRWVLASGNRGKLRELRALLAPLEIELVGQDELKIAPLIETGQTFVENALAKARHAAAGSRLPAIADDSGLAVDALGGAPGVHSARYAGVDASDESNIAKLLQALLGVAAADRGACFHCALVAMTHVADPAPIVAQGIWRGVISDSPRGQGGFGYDPIFIGRRMNATAAELEAQVKNSVSHRATALANLVAALGVAA